MREVPNTNLHICNVHRRNNTRFRGIKNHITSTTTGFIFRPQMERDRQSAILKVLKRHRACRVFCISCVILLILLILFIEIGNSCALQSSQYSNFTTVRFLLIFDYGIIIISPRGFFIYFPNFV